MIEKFQNIEALIKTFRVSIKQSGIVSQLLLKKIGKPSERRRQKAKIALRRKRQRDKRAGLNQRGNGFKSL